MEKTISYIRYLVQTDIFGSLLEVKSGWESEVPIHLIAKAKENKCT